MYNHLYINILQIFHCGGSMCSKCWSGCPRLGPLFDRGDTAIHCSDHINKDGSKSDLFQSNRLLLYLKWWLEPFTLAYPGSLYLWFVGSCSHFFFLKVWKQKQKQQKYLNSKHIILYSVDLGARRKLFCIRMWTVSIRMFTRKHSWYTPLLNTKTFCTQ